METILNKTTREIILDRLDEIRQKLFTLNELIKEGDAEFVQWRELKADILRVERERLKKTLIDNEMQFFE